MTAGELITALEKFPKDTLIAMYEWELGYWYRAREVRFVESKPFRITTEEDITSFREEMPKTGFIEIT